MASVARLRSSRARARWSVEADLGERRRTLMERHPVEGFRSAPRLELRPGFSPRGGGLGQRPWRLGPEGSVLALLLGGEVTVGALWLARAYAGTSRASKGSSHDLMTEDFSAAGLPPSVTRRVGWGFITLYALAYLVQFFSGDRLGMFLIPCHRRRLDPTLRRHAGRPAPGRRGPADLVDPGARRHVLRVPAYEPRLRLGPRQPLPVRPGVRLPRHLPGVLPAGEGQQRRGGGALPDLPRHALLRAAGIIVASIVGGRLSDSTGRRKTFVATASLVYGLALFVIALATTFNGYLVGMAIGGLGLASTWPSVPASGPSPSSRSRLSGEHRTARDPRTPSSWRSGRGSQTRACSRCCGRGSRRSARR
jgi:hypothetical protein